MMPTRRQLLIGATAAALIPAPAVAADYVIDWQGLPPDPAVQTRIDQQIAMVRASPVSADIAKRVESVSRARPLRLVIADMTP